MPYVDLAGLSRYASRQKERLERDYALLRDMQWLRTEKAGAVSLWPAGGTPLKPVVDFLFSETPPAEGEKGLSNPSTITGVTQAKVTRCGKNLAELNRVYAFPGRGITATVNANGSVHVEGTSGGSIPIIDIGNHDDSANKQLPYWMEVGKTYTISFSSSNVNGNPCAQIYLSNSLTAWGSAHTVFSGESYTFLVDDTRKRALIRIGFDRNSTINCDCYLQIEEGSSATSFDGTIPDVYTLPLGSTYYGGTLDVASGVMTVGYASVIFNGTEVWSADTPQTNVATFFNTSSIYPGRQTQPGVVAYCEYFPRISNSTADTVGFGLYGGNEGGYFKYPDPSMTIEGFRSWLAEKYNAGKPVTVVYKLATPYTVQLTPVQISALLQQDKYTPRLNTIYTDAQAVQVGYVKSPIREEQELQQAIVSQGGNI